MYEDLIKELREYSNARKGEIAEITKEAADAIEELQGKTHILEKLADHWCNKVPKWIPVTERLPEKDIEVLVFAEGIIEGFFGDTVIAISKRYDFKIFTDSEGVEVWKSPWQYFLKDYEITYWMPLPEQPKEET